MTDSHAGEQANRLGELRYSKPSVGRLRLSQPLKAELTVVEEETLSDLVLKDYGSAAKEKWIRCPTTDKSRTPLDP